MRRAKCGDRTAIQRLVAASFGIVIEAAIKWRRRGGGDFDDIIQEGAAGMLRAIQTFDVERGVRFISYASYWVNAFIMDYAVRQRSLIRVGQIASERTVFFGYGRACRELAARGVEESRAAVAQQLGVSEAAVVAINRGGESSLDVLRDQDSRGRSRWEPAALDFDPETAVAESEEMAKRRAVFRRALARLPKRDRQILQMRFVRDPTATLAEVGARFRISRERVRQVEKRALAKVRAHVQRAFAPRRALIQLSAKRDGARSRRGSAW